jgi:hypothetical protein
MPMRRFAPQCSRCSQNAELLKKACLESAIQRVHHWCAHVAHSRRLHAAASRMPFAPALGVDGTCHANVTGGMERAPGPYDMQRCNMARGTQRDTCHEACTMALRHAALQRGKWRATYNVARGMEGKCGATCGACSNAQPPKTYGHSLVRAQRMAVCMSLTLPSLWLC